MLTRYIDACYASFDAQDCAELDALLQQQDTDLWIWFSGKQAPPDEITRNLVKRIRAAAGHSSPSTD